MVKLQVVDIPADNSSTGHTEVHCSKFAHGDNFPRPIPWPYEFSSLLSTIFYQHDCPDTKWRQVVCSTKSLLHSFVYHCSNSCSFVTNRSQNAQTLTWVFNVFDGSEPFRNVVDCRQGRTDLAQRFWCLSKQRLHWAHFQSLTPSGIYSQCCCGNVLVSIPIPFRKPSANSGHYQPVRLFSPPS